MRRLALVVTVSVAWGALLGTGGPAAAVSAKKACKTLETLQENLDEATEDFTAADLDQDAFKAFKKIGKAFRKTAKTAPRKVKSSLTTLASVYEALGKSRNATSAIAAYNKSIQKFSKAAANFGVFYAENCAASNNGARSTGRTGGGGSSGGVSATVTLGSETFTFTDATDCTLQSGFVSAVFADGGDSLSLTSTGSVVLVRMTLDGVNWVDPGSSTPEPEIARNTATWEGSVRDVDGGEARDAMIEISC